MAMNRFDGGRSTRGRWLSRRATLRWLASAGGAAAAALRLGGRPANAARQDESGPTRAEAEALAKGITDALTSDPDRLDEWVAEDVVGHIPLAPDGAGKGLAGLKEKASVIIAAISDAEITVDGLAVDGETVAAHGEIHGTHDGPLADLPATGARVRAQYVIFTRIADGKVVEYWYQLDILGALQQLDLYAIPEGDDAGDGETPEPTPEDGY